MPIWALSAISSLVCYGLWTITNKLSIQYIDPKVALLYVIFGEAITFILVATLTPMPWSLQPQGVGLALLTGVLQYFALFFFLMALSQGSLSLVSIMVALYPVISIIFGTLVLDEPLTLRQGMGVGLAIAAVVLIAA
ncbi:MAG: EamA family transporter [Leptolyngbyaceae bacterium]|nr:EamA family transporter [Leptolyngbyaceae bacterium]